MFGWVDGTPDGTGPLVAVYVSILDRIWKAFLIQQPFLLGKLSEVHFTRCPWISLAGHIALYLCLALRGFLSPSYSPNPHAFKVFLRKTFSVLAMRSNSLPGMIRPLFVLAHLRVG
ncbi:hypothetical protein M9458_051017 [Cirrhinus mrigala]|uniref:Uncharacterized protein n=1 Tax=Cirrhinus mrigala TaxID=683832 RepID=A0ABD0MWU5_CIRMR